jgi:hypothetical protein
MITWPNFDIRGSCGLMELTYFLNLLSSSTLKMRATGCLKHFYLLTKLHGGVTLPWESEISSWSVRALRNWILVRDLRSSHLKNQNLSFSRSSLLHTWDSFHNIFVGDFSALSVAGWVPCLHGMARPQVADGGDGLQLRILVYWRSSRWQPTKGGSPA